MLLVFIAARYTGLFLLRKLSRPLKRGRSSCKSPLLPRPLGRVAPHDGQGAPRWVAIFPSRGSGDLPCPLQQSAWNCRPLPGVCRSLRCPVMILSPLPLFQIPQPISSSINLAPTQTHTLDSTLFFLASLSEWNQNYAGNSHNPGFHFALVGVPPSQCFFTPTGGFRGGGRTPRAIPRGRLPRARAPRRRPLGSHPPPSASTS